METTTKKQLQKLIIDWIDPNNDARSGNKLAKKMGISNANVSNIKNEKWSSIGDDIWNKVAAYFQIKMKNDDWRQFETYNFIKVQEVLHNAQSQQRRAAISGDTGWGKTNAIKHYCNARGNEEAFHITCRRSMNPNKFVENIAETIGVSSIIGVRYEIERAIADKILTMGMPILIFDELENLSHTNFSVIKTIIDLTDKNASFVLCGIEVRAMIKKFAKKGKDAFRQIQRRFPAIGYECLYPLSREEMTAILNEIGIANRFAHDWFFENIFDMDALESTVREGMRLSRKHDEEINRIFLTEYFGDESEKAEVI